MSVNPKQPGRKVKTHQDLGSIEAISYNDSAGAKKVIIISAPIKKTVAANEELPFGSLVKITGTSYTLDLINRSYSVTKTYQKGDIISESSDIYMALEDRITGTFDSTKWKKVAPKQIASIPCNAGTVVSLGRWHNTVTVVGFLVDDDSQMDYTRVRD